MKRRLAFAATLAVLICAGVSGAAPAALDLRLVSETQTTFTLGWTPLPGIGYRFAVDGKIVSHTWDQNRATVTFRKGATKYDVEQMVLGETGSWPPALPPSKAQCEDGLDNDDDGLIDFPQDPGCLSATDDDEFNPPPPSDVCTIDNWQAWGPIYNPGDCVIGTTITRVNQMWACDMPLSAYGELPIRVVQTWDVTTPVGQIGIDLRTGCTGVAGNEINLIIEQSVVGVGRISDPLKTRMVPGPQNIRLTGELNASGPDATPGAGDHQDCIQIQSNGDNFFVNVKGCGDENNSNTQAAGGTFFFSLNNPKAHVRGGEYNGCNHSLEVDTRELGTGIRESTVVGARFRSGNNTAPWCVKGNFNAGAPCTGSPWELAEFAPAACERFVNGAWVDATPPKPPAFQRKDR